jgi:hypothetical protein
VLGWRRGWPEQRIDGEEEAVQRGFSLGYLAWRRGKEKKRGAGGRG